MASDAQGREAHDTQQDALADVLASIRNLVSAEVKARSSASDNTGDDVLMLTEQMRVARAPARSGEILSEGLGSAPARPPGAPILDEEALRGMINTIVREELQGELGDRISRNLRKLIRQEMSQIAMEKPEE